MNIRRYLTVVTIAAILSLSACTLPTDPTFVGRAGAAPQHQAQSLADSQPAQS